jgi:hypothetical protein
MMFDIVFNNGVDCFCACYLIICLFVVLPLIIIFRKKDTIIFGIGAMSIILFIAGVTYTTPLQEQFVETIQFTILSTYTEDTYYGKQIVHKYFIRCASNKYGIHTIETDNTYSNKYNVYAFVNTNHDNAIVYYEFRRIPEVATQDHFFDHI